MKDLNGGEPDVSGTSAVAASCFQMVQEVHDQRGIELLQLPLRGWKFNAMAGVCEQKPEGVRIGIAGVGAGALFYG